MDNNENGDTIDLVFVVYIGLFVFMITCEVFSTLIEITTSSTDELSVNIECLPRIPVCQYLLNVCQIFAHRLVVLAVCCALWNIICCIADYAEQTEEYATRNEATASATSWSSVDVNNSDAVPKLEEEEGVPDGMCEIKQPQKGSDPPEPA